MAWPTYTVVCTKVELPCRAEFRHKNKTVVVVYPPTTKMPEVGETRQIRAYSSGRGSFWVDVTAGKE